MSAWALPGDFRATAKGAAGHTYALGLAQIRQGVTEIDFSSVKSCDSTLVAAVIGWQRAAAQSGHTLKLHHVPQGFSKLAQLYGVDSLVNYSHA
jgi:ABC-type transporter Mla MlaB component